MARSRDIFTTIHTEGALLPPDLLQRIAEGDSGLDGLTPESYHLSGERLNEAINRAWNRLQGAWANFQAARAVLPQSDAGTSLTRERWLLPLFAALDYGRLETARAVEIDGKSYAISHRWRDVPIHLVSFRLDLDQRVRGVAGAAAASPHSLLQVYLNRSDDTLWGLLSNGLRLRILRDNASLTRQAYVEFDLEAMMEGEVYADFVLLYLLCHQSRVEADRPADFWLEQWMNAAQQQGTRALDQLRDGVQSAIECLGVGFIAHPTNNDLRDRLQSGDLSTQDYYRQLLRLVYRLLFLFTAEDRDLLHPPGADETARQHYHSYYSTRRLREMAGRIKGTRHHDLFEGLRLVMRLLSGEDPYTDEHRALLGLPALNGWLLREEALPDVMACEIANRDLLDAVRALAFTEDRAARVLRPVDYKNLGPEELGSVYESLLELHPQINVEARLFALETAAGHERKTTGSYYTPDSLVQALLDSALDPVIEQAVKGPGKAPTPGPSPSGGGEIRVREMATKAMRDIARELRQRETPAEQILWEALRKNRLGGLGFRRQHPVANTHYVVDFFCYQANLIVELDGEVHQFQQRDDARRQADLEALGYRVLRFSNERITNDLENVLIEILSAARAPTPGPSPSGGGELQVPPHEGEGFRVGARAGATAEERLLSLKICDPACGSGHFLIAAARRIAHALARVRTGEDEPPPAALRRAVRDVIGHCIYGVDINPMAVELCKVNLWIEALEPGKPLSFLDHRIQCGNSLLGTTPALMAGGIPDEAFQPIEGDDREVVSGLRKRNRQERSGQLDMFVLPVDPSADAAAMGREMRGVEAIPDSTIEGIRAREERYYSLLESPAHRHARLAADAWCAAFVWEKRASTDPNTPPPITDLVFRRLATDGGQIQKRDLIEAEVARLAEQYQFFHWHVAFPDVFDVPKRMEDAENPQTGWSGGFDCVLGNPPWERIKIQEKEWFAERNPDIAAAPNAAARRRMIEVLIERDPYLLAAFLADKRRAEGEGHFVLKSGRYPLCGRGDVNTYTIFAETSTHIVSPTGRVGVIVPSGIATDDTTKYFFQHLMDTRTLASLYDFENREGLFPAVDSRMKFCLLTLTGKPSPLAPLPEGEGKRGRGLRGEGAEFVFFAHSVADLQDEERRFTLSAEDIALINPNTRTSPIFRSRRDAELTKAIYRRVPVLVRDNPPLPAEGEGDTGGEGNPWGITFLRMFDMSNDSHLFHTRGQLEAAGYVLEGNRFVAPHPPAPSLLEGEGEQRGAGSPLSPERERGLRGEGAALFLPLYEAKMMHQFDHRWATYDGPDTRDLTDDEKRDPWLLPLPRYWVSEEEVAARIGSTPYMIGFRDIARSTDERTAIAGLVPWAAVGHKAPLIFINESLEHSFITCFVACIDSLCFDYGSRQKVGGTSMTFFIVKQLPVLPPHTYTPDLLAFITPRVLELTYTAWDLQAFAQDVGWDGPPFIWDEDRRFLLRCELDALYFHLYQIARDDVDYIMETFPIVRRKDEAAYGEYRTKRVILQMYDQMAALPRVAVPHPKAPLPRPLPPQGEGELQVPPPEGEGFRVGADYLVPDVSQFETWLSPPPADSSVALLPKT